MQKINKQQVFNYYNKSRKWHGIIDYKSLSIFIVYFVMIIYIIYNLKLSSTISIYLLVIFIVPVLIFILLNINEDYIFDKLVIIIIFFMTRKIYSKHKNINFLPKIYTKNVKNNHIEK